MRIWRENDFGIVRPGSETSKDRSGALAERSGKNHAIKHEIPVTHSLSSSRCVAPDWNLVRQTAAQEEWAAALVKILDVTFDRRIAAWPDEPPRAQSEWTHHYYCDRDASRLIFDPAKPKEHVCPECGAVYSGEPWDGAWRTLVHGTLVSNLERAAILARTQSDPSKYISYLRRIVLFYAGHYADYPVHGVRAGKGKIMPQCLDESIIIISMGRYLTWGEDAGWFTEKELAFIAEKLFRPAVDLLKPQITKIHNIHAWMQSAVAAAAYWLKDDALLRWTIESKFGWRQQTRQGVDDDGFWYEGSISYHFYTVSALLSHALTASDSGIPLWDEPKFRLMLKGPLELVHRNGTFPAHNDCWPGVSLLHAAGSYEIAAAAWPEERFQGALGWIYKSAKGDDACRVWTSTGDLPAMAASGFARNSTAALLYGTRLDENYEPPRTSRVLKSAGIGILENGVVRVCMRFGKDGGGHDHCDKLNVDVACNNGWESPDVGSSGYGAEITNKWYKTPAAHNIVVVNAQKQQHSDGELAGFDDKSLSARATNAYPGANLARTLELNATGWADIFHVECPAESTLDWFFHGTGAISTGLQMKPVAGFGSEPGYAWIREAKSCVVDGDWELQWTDGGAEMHLKMQGCPGTEVFVGVSDDNPATRTLGAVMVRRKATVTTFRAMFECKVAAT